MLQYFKTASGLNRLLKAEDGATAIEYGLIAGLIAVVLIAGATALGTNLSAMFQGVATKVSNATPPAA